MSITVHERPGVFSTYAASGTLSGAAGRKKVGLAARCEAQQPVRVSRYDQAVAAFGAETDGSVTQLVRLLLQNGAAEAVVFPVAGSGLEHYKAAFAQMEQTEQLEVVMCDSTGLEVQQALRDSVNRAAQAQRERVAVVCGGSGETVEQLTQRAEGLNSERVVLVCPGAVDAKGAAASGVQGAAAAAGAIAGQSDPAVPLGGAQLQGLYGLERRYDDGELDLLLQGGVTPLEATGGAVSVVRGVTTCTSSGGAPDGTWHELSTVLIADDVIPAIRSALRARFRRAKNTPQTRGAIRSQVVLELENKLEREIITGYDLVSVQADSEEPTRCLVEFGFTVTHGLNQIWLTARITV